MSSRLAESCTFVLALGKSLLNEQDWYEKDLSDFDDPQLSDEEHEGRVRFLCRGSFSHDASFV